LATNDLTTLLANFSATPFDPKISLEIALTYEGMAQYAAAVTFYTRCMENTNDDILKYTCLIKLAGCFDQQKGRPATVRSFYKHAICLLPKRPEAYFFLAKHYEWIKEYADSYMFCCQALEFCDFSSLPLSSEVGYPGKYGIIFQKAVAAWWWGKASESRALFHSLADSYIDEMDDAHIQAVQTNMSSLGSGPESQAFRYYDKSKHSKLKYKFQDSELIDRNYSQVFQDMFVLAALNGKKGGTYLEIGSAKPYHGNNTALLEQKFGWTGVGIEYKEEFANEYRQHRNNPVLCKDARKINYIKLLKEISKDGKTVDYLQLDCEPSAVTFELLLAMPFDQYKFGIITYEHDYYVDITRSYREKSRKYLESQGYVLIVNDVAPDNISTFEDWWAHPDIIDPKILEQLRCNSGKVTQIESYFYSE
jgi:tetratricopeptide (TPR) repeat protein